MACLLGLDVGTTGAKAVLIAEDGQVLASATTEYPMSTPKPLWAEQNPEDWWQAAQQSFRKVLAAANVKPAEVKGIGLTGQMHGLVLLDKHGEVLRPCIMWNDQRTAAQCKAITDKVGAKQILELTGNPVLPGFTAPKIVWVREHEPEVYKKAAQVLLPKDYIRYRLTGDYATDVSDASGTSLLDVKQRAWSEEMLNKLDIKADWMPRVYESPEITGEVSKAAADVTSLKAGTPVVGGGGDQAAGAVGNGVVRPGAMSVTIGTSGVVFAHTDELAIEPEGRLHAFCHAVPGAWHVMGVTLAAGGSLRWFRDVLAQSEISVAGLMGVDTYELLAAEASQAPSGCEGLFFLPYLSGERTPYPDANARGAFFGLTLRHTKSHLIRSVLEGVAFSLRDCMELIRGMGLDVTSVYASGGGARSELWRQILADVLDLEMQTLTSTEGAPYGAALLAGVGTGIYETVESACRRTIKVSTSTPPDSANVKLYAKHYEVYRMMYASFKPTYESISAVSSSNTNVNKSKS